MSADNGAIDRYCDQTIQNEKIQLFQKSRDNDYGNFPGIDIDMRKGLRTPNLRKNTYMEVKLFFELNTFLEKRDFLLDVYVWDRMCAEHGAKLYLFNFTERLKFPSNFEYYGKLNNTVIASKTVEAYLADTLIDHTKFYLEDNEHYNREYHKYISDKYLPWLKAQ